jgi:ABC-type methionine transport system ATPase subunit
MARKRVRFTYPEVLIKEPIIYQLGREFQVVTNIRMADIDEKTAWAMLELDGDADEIARALDWAEAKGVRVDPVEGDIVEGN